MQLRRTIIPMGTVAAKQKIMPEPSDIDIEALENNIENAVPEGAELKGIERQPIAFGLVALYPTVLIPDGEGGTDQVEEAFSQVEGVGSVGVEAVGRI